MYSGKLVLPPIIIDQNKVKNLLLGLFRILCNYSKNTQHLLIFLLVFEYILFQKVIRLYNCHQSSVFAFLEALWGCSVVQQQIFIVRPIHTERKRKQKISLMFDFFYLFPFARCERALGVGRVLSVFSY